MWLHRGLAGLKTVTSPMASDEVMMCRKKHSASPPPVFDDSSQFRGEACCRWTESATSFRLANASFAQATSSLEVPQRMTLTRGASLTAGLVAVPDMRGLQAWLPAFFAPTAPHYHPPCGRTICMRRCV